MNEKWRWMMIIPPMSRERWDISWDWLGNKIVGSLSSTFPWISALLRSSWGRELDLWIELLLPAIWYLSSLLYSALFSCLFFPLSSVSWLLLLLIFHKVNSNHFDTLVPPTHQLRCVQTIQVFELWIE